MLYIWFVLALSRMTGLEEPLLFIYFSITDFNIKFLTD